MIEENIKKEISAKEQKFIELANKRVNKAIRELRLIANLGNKGNYTYSNDQALKIIRALQKEVDMVKERLRGDNRNAKDEFKL